MDRVIFLFIALIIDLIIGDPHWFPHPVVLIGKAITGLENLLREKTYSARAEKLKGAVLVFIIIAGSYLTAEIILLLSGSLNNYLAYFLEVFILSLLLALKGLIAAGKEVYQALKAGDLKLARQKVNLIVGRDCSKSSRKEVIRAVLETLAENTSDGIIAPVFYYFLGGLPLALTYKAVNTMDSMLGYQNQKYQNFGFTAAKIDDLFNLIPARMTASIMVIASFLLKYDYQAALQTIFKDASKHPSPNAGYPEAAAAGALGLRFGGLNYYHGRESFRAYIGEEKKEFELEDISKLNKIIYLSVLIFISAVVFLFLLF